MCSCVTPLIACSSSLLLSQVWTDDGDVEIIANDQGNRVTPSYVAFTESERLIGDAAKNQAALNPKNTIFDAKSLPSPSPTNRELWLLACLY